MSLTMLISYYIIIRSFELIPEFDKPLHLLITINSALAKSLSRRFLWAHSLSRYKCFTLITSGFGFKSAIPKSRLQSQTLKATDLDSSRLSRRLSEANTFNDTLSVSLILSKASKVCKYRSLINDNRVLSSHYMTCIVHIF